MLFTLLVVVLPRFFFFFFFNDTATTEIYTLSLHDALPLSPDPVAPTSNPVRRFKPWGTRSLYTRAADWSQQKDVQAARKTSRRRRATLRVLILAGIPALG